MSDNPSNPFNPTKPGQFNDWALHVEKYGDLGAGRGTTHESFISNSNSSGVGWGHSGASTSSPTYSSAAPAYASSSIVAPIASARSYGGYSGGGGYSAAGGSSSGAGWFVGIAAVIAIIALANSGHDGKKSAATSTADRAASMPAAWHNGKADRDTWENWFTGLSGESRDGADYWATVRSTHPPAGVCSSGRGWGSADFRQGCLNARTFLLQVDHRRDTEPYYRYGWNYTIPPQKS